MGEITETTVVTSSEEVEDPSVLAQAAVASAALSGAAAVRANDANDTADEANARAQGAEALASASLAESASKPDEETTRRIAREEAAATLAALLEEAAHHEPVRAPEPATTEVDPQVLPPSVKKANASGKRHRFADWYHGDEA